MNKILDYNEFDRVEKSDWESQVKKDLKLEDLSNLLWKPGPGSGREMQLYYNREDLEGLEYLSGFHHFLITKSSGWKNYSRISMADSSILQESVNQCYYNGTEGIILEISNARDIENLRSININPKLELSLELKNKTQLDKTQLQSIISLPNDGGFLSGGKDNQNLFIEGCRTCELTAQKSPAANELAELLTQSKKYIDNFENSKSYESLTKNMFVKVLVGGNFFDEIAKLRALRIVFFALNHSYGIPPRDIEPIYIYCVSSIYRNNDYGPHENMLKSTSAAMSAIIGGCNALWVEPEDESTLARRIALNVSSILRDEAYFGNIIDPSYGSYYVEQYSHQIATDGWKMFVNKTGG